MLQHLLVWVTSRCTLYKAAPLLKNFKTRCFLFFLMFSFLGISCSHQLDKEDYIQWVHDYKNGLHVKKEYSDFVFDVQYQPSQYVSLVKGSSREEDSLQYYVLRIKPINPSADLINAASAVEKQQRLYYFSYLFQQHISLEQHGATTPCVLFHFEQSDLSNERTFLLGFEQSDVDQLLSNESELVIQSPFISSLPVKIKFSTGNIPTLKL